VSTQQRMWAVLLVLIVLSLSSGSSSQSTSNNRLIITPAIIGVGDSFVISLNNLSSSERELSSVAVYLTSSKLNEDVRTLSLIPNQFLTAGDWKGGSLNLFSLTVQTHRSEVSSRQDLTAVNVMPGTRLEVSYV